MKLSLRDVDWLERVASETLKSSLASDHRLIFPTARAAC
jgi:hypothetical protein